MAALAVDPATPSVVYAGTWGGGVFRLQSEQYPLHFAQFGKGAGQLSSEIILVNANESTTAGARILVRDDEGLPLRTDLNGQVIRGEAATTVSASGVRRLTSDSRGPIQAGSVTAESDQPLAGVLLFGGAAGVAGVGAGEPLSAGFLAPIESRAIEGIETGIAVQNLSDRSSEVELALFDVDGNVLATSELSGDRALAPFGHFALFVHEFVWTPAVDFSNFLGLLEVRSSERIAATVLQTHPGEFVTMPVVPLQTSAASGRTGFPRGTDTESTSLYFAHYGDGAVGDLRLFSQILLINPDPTSPALAELTLRGDDGGEMSVDLNGEEVRGKINVQIPARGIRIFRTDGMGEIQAGSAQVVSDRPLAGVILFGGSVGFAGVGSSRALESSFVAPMQSDQVQGIDTGVALMNLENRSTVVDLILTDERGETLAQARLEGEDSIPALGHVALFIDDFDWNEAIDFSDFRGLLQIRPTGRLAATVLQTRPAQFATMPVAPR